MSDWFLEASRNPRSRPAIILTWALLTAHLFGLVPLRHDPIHLGFLWMRSMLHSNSTAE